MNQTRLLGKHHHVFTDNFYTKLPLAEALLRNDTYLTGTVNKKSKDLSRAVVGTQYEAGQTVYFRKGKVLLVGYKQKKKRKPVYRITTACHAEDRNIVSRSGLQAVKPLVIHKYNLSMGGVDQKDKSIYHHSCTRPTRKYWRKIFFNLMDMAMLNAYILYSRNTDHPLSRKRFMVDIVETLVRQQPPAEPVQVEPKVGKIDDTPLPILDLPGPVSQESCSNLQVSCSEVDIGSISSSIFHSSNKCVNTSDEEKLNILKGLFVPDATFKFPTTQLQKKHLKFQHNWLQRWNWLAYSKLNDGAYCKFCVLFSSECLGKGDLSVRTASLVGQPFKKWKDAVEKFQHHSNRNYHKLATISADNFLKVAEGRIEDVATILDNRRKQEKEQNRAAILPIIETIILCGEQELPLRGDNDSGPLTLEKPKNKDGKFRALIRHRAAYDSTLQDHVIKCPKNVTYLSPDIQNEIIGICGQIIQEKLAANVNSAECFSIIGDETLDVSGQEQLSICIRYVTNEEHSSLREDFVTFVPLVDLGAESIAQKIIEACRKLGIDLENKLVGQGYDGASTMSGCKSGVQTRIAKLFPKAMYVHCSSHRLNLVLSDSLNVPLITNSLGVLKETVSFFRHNTQAGDILKENVKIFCPESTKSRLLKLCETRFVERQDSVNSFVELFPAIVPSLRQLSELNRSFSVTASTLLAAMEKGSFLVSILVCEYIFGLTLPLSLYLQSPTKELASAIKYCDDILNRLKDLRAGSGDEEQFHKIFERSKLMSELVLECEIEVPRQTKSQTKRDNHPHSSPEDYFKRAVFIPAIDGLIVNIEERFNQNRKFMSSIEVILPKNCSLQDLHLLENLNVYYESRVSQELLNAEYSMWCQKWSSVKKSDRPTQLMTVIDSCDKNFYPNIRYLLCVLASLPVSTCEAERSFSALKRIKTYLRNRMGNERLTGLALMAIHYPVPFTAEDVLNVMAAKGKRKFIL
ncbi:52 kDa repressor of the inhibitor of the protein kinase-like [Macrosteles quadrilineatus]|uniref:52 kDa repressor of the inhibitor of the protein kinase-like n=1 Tax=Macrosteles quadrilineatus TaxID=74068 RepID=UPI0023E24B98|nr:52 kDa repressor of the inhibitor of the protein kinase-like [Macrosteles quadrilineatus]